jgi:hypothetical protein
MTREMKGVIWEWLPGVAAGFMPLFVFLLVKAQAMPDPHLTGAAAAQAAHLASARTIGGLAEHLVVFAIVTSTVSTFTTYPRLFARGRADPTIGPASLGLVMLMTFMLVFSTAEYVLHESSYSEPSSFWQGGLLALATLILSFYMEVTIANVSMARNAGSATPAT